MRYGVVVAAAASSCCCEEDSLKKIRVQKNQITASQAKSIKFIVNSRLSKQNFFFWFQMNFHKIDFHG